jgi:AcrR family transcriptional regulator
MPRTKEQFQEMRDKSKKHILDIALKMFSSRGFYTTTINQIAKEAGIATGLIYNYFESKEDLLDAIVKNSLQEFYIRFTQLMEEGKYENKIQGFIESIFPSIKEVRESWRFLFSLVLQPGITSKTKSNYDHLSNHIESFVISQFEAIGKPDSQHQAKIFSALFQGAILNYIIHEDEASFELVKNEVLKKFY